AQKKVTGTVTNAKDKVPVPSASILVKGTNIGTSTSSDGTFSINVPAGRNTLVVSSVGFNNEEVDVSSVTTVAISLTETVSSLNEIVVTGYSAQRKKD